MVGSTALLAAVIPTVVGCVATAVAAYFIPKLWLRIKWCFIKIWSGLTWCFFMIFPTFETNRVQENVVPSPGVMTKVGLPIVVPSNPGQSSGALVLSARKLEIKHGNDVEWWDWVKNSSDEGFTEVAELKEVYHFEIKATVNFRDLSPQKDYAAFLIYKTKDNSEGLDIHYDAFVKVAENKVLNKVCLKPSMDIGSPLDMSDNWMELKLGQFHCDDVTGNKKAEISIKNTNYNIKKTGLIVQAIEIRPI